MSQSSGYGYGDQRQGYQQGYNNQNFYHRSDKNFYDQGEFFKYIILVFFLKREIVLHGAGVFFSNI